MDETKQTGTESGVVPPVATAPAVSAPATSGLEALGWGLAEKKLNQCTINGRIVKVSRAMKRTETTDANGNVTVGPWVEDLTSERRLLIIETLGPDGKYHVLKPVSTFPNHWPYGTILETPGAPIKVTMYTNTEGYPTVLSVQPELSAVSASEIALMAFAAKLKSPAMAD